jgi:hypothetical protein
MRAFEGTHVFAVIKGDRAMRAVKLATSDLNLWLPREFRKAETMIPKKTWRNSKSLWSSVTLIVMAIVFWPASG